MVEITGSSLGNDGLYTINVTGATTCWIKGLDAVSGTHAAETGLTANFYSVRASFGAVISGVSLVRADVSGDAVGAVEYYGNAGDALAVGRLVLTDGNLGYAYQVRVMAVNNPSTATYSIRADGSLNISMPSGYANHAATFATVASGKYAIHASHNSEGTAAFFGGDSDNGLPLVHVETTGTETNGLAAYLKGGTPEGSALFGSTRDATSDDLDARGVYGRTINGVGVRGDATGTGIGIEASSAGSGAALDARSSSSGNTVTAVASGSGNAVSATSTGTGNAISATGAQLGLDAASTISKNTAANQTYGVVGEIDASSGSVTGAGVYGLTARGAADDSGASGIRGVTNDGFGVYGSSNNAAGTGVVGNTFGYEVDKSIGVQIPLTAFVPEDTPDITVDPSSSAYDFSANNWVLNSSWYWDTTSGEMDLLLLWDGLPHEAVVTSLLINWQSTGTPTTEAKVQCYRHRAKGTTAGDEGGTGTVSALVTAGAVDFLNTGVSTSERQLITFTASEALRTFHKGQDLFGIKVTSASLDGTLTRVYGVQVNFTFRKHGLHLPPSVA